MRAAHRAALDDINAIFADVKAGRWTAGARSTGRSAWKVRDYARTRSARCFSGRPRAR